jgi:hypothetical protein
MNQKAERMNTAGRVTAWELGQIILDSENICAYCGVEMDSMEGSFDHVISYDQGGINLPENIVRSCLTCNRTKGSSKTPADLLAFAKLRVVCPVDGKLFRPRWADWKRGLGKYCSRRCAGKIGGQA